MTRIARRFAFICVALLGACSDTTAPIDPDLAVATPGDTLFSAVVSGYSHTCALTVGGRAFCWGNGWNGELGIDPRPTTCPGEPADSPFVGCATVPTPVAGGLRFTQLSAGWDRTCGLTVSGRLYCWGGALSTGFPGSSVPIPLGGDLRFSAISVSEQSKVVCALGTDGQGYCWGDNNFGQLGTSTGIGHPGPLSSLGALPPVEGNHLFATIESRVGTSCGTTTAGSLYCWGGQPDTVRFDAAPTAAVEACFYGPVSTPCTHVPAKWRGPESWARLVSSGDTCGITSSGAVLCWGDPVVDWGPAVFGRTQPANPNVLPVEPWEVASAVPLRDIMGHPGGYGACAHAVDGRVVCWGRSSNGEFGTGALFESYTVPTVVAGGRAFTQIAAGPGYMCGLTAGGEILCWGGGGIGLLGVGFDVPRQPNGNLSLPTPTRIASIAGK
jgi:alpha-tubulin suppressor-like RCC1 family protein